MNEVSETRNAKGQFVNGHPMPKEWREQISVSTRGSKNPFYNKKHSSETRTKIKEARSKQDMSWRRGKKHSPETILKISQTRRSVSARGADHFLWKGGCESYLKIKRKELDNYTCRQCGLYDEEIMDVDHIIPKSVAPHLRNDIENLQTLCPNCHKRKTLSERKNKSY